MTGGGNPRDFHLHILGTIRIRGPCKRYGHYMIIEPLMTGTVPKYIQYAYIICRDLETVASSGIHFPPVASHSAVTGAGQRPHLPEYLLDGSFLHCHCDWLRSLRSKEILIHATSGAW